MPHELIYTSAPRGLKPGSTGYCTVAQTPDLPKDLAEQLEGISHYRHLRVDDPNANPPSFAHSILTTGYYVHHVLSRVADSGLDHSGRSNFLAHHAVFDPDHLPDAGPAWLCEQRLFYLKWDRGAGMLPGDRSIPSGRSEPRVCTKWQRLTGDAGWGGALASATNAAEPAYIIYEPGQDVLGLLVESMALLSPEARWNVTFNTYFTGKAVRTTCQWRCVTADSAEAREAIASRRGLVIRLDEQMSGSPEGALVEAARTGEVDRPASRRKAASVHPGRTPRPPEPEDLPEPMMPASRPIRTRSPEPAVELEDSQYDMPAVAAPRASGRSGVGALLLGLLLGGLLVLLVVLGVELGGQQSLLGDLKKSNMTTLETEKNDLASQVSKLEKEVGAIRSDLNAEKLAASGERTSHEATRSKLETEKKNLVSANSALRFLMAMIKTSREKPLPSPDPSLNMALADAKAEAAKWKSDHGKLQEKLANLGNNGPALSVVRLDKVQLGGQPAADLFKVKLLANAKPKLDVFGLPADIKATPLGEGGEKGVLLKSVDTGFDATITVGKDGTVRIEGMNMDKHPCLGMGVIRLNPGTGESPAYRQLFWPVHAVGGGLNADLAKGPIQEGRTRKYVLPLTQRLGPLLRIEAALLKGPNQFAGRNARIGIAGKNYELEPGLDPFTIENRPADSEPAVKLKVENGEVMIEATFADAASAADKVSIEAMEIVRLIPEDKERSFPGCIQEVYRVYPKSN